MDYLWSPWRYRYVVQASPGDECIFCSKPAAGDDAANLIVFRGERSFVLLNLFPYTTGHLMVAPYQHVATLEDAPEETAVEMMRLARRASAHLRAIYRSPGLNLGMNVGECAGAGVAGHIHLHVLPRWPGDTNFVTTVAETRVLPEDLSVTYGKVSRAFAVETGELAKLPRDGSQ
jgi:ATP adenylyltransferase